MLSENKIKGLENEIEQKSFSTAHKSKNSNWYWTSIIFQVLNVLICFFGLFLFLSKVIDDFPGKEYIIGTISLFILYFWEKLKRQTLRETTLKFFKAKKEVNSSQIPNILLSLFLIACSSLIAIQGGKELSDKSGKIEVVHENNIKIETDSINKYYNKELLNVDSRISYIYENAFDRKRNKRPLTTLEKDEVLTWEKKKEGLEKEKEAKIKKIEIKIESKQSKETDKTKNIVMIFIISTLLFESFILIGVSYCAIYDFNSFFEVVNSEKYRRLKQYNNYLEMFYKNGNLKKDDLCPSENSFKEIIKIKTRNYIEKHMKEFLTVLRHLQIIQTRSKKRYFLKDYSEAQAKVKEYLESLEN